MKNRLSLFLVSFYLLTASVITCIISGCNENTKTDQSIVYEDMETAFEQSDLLSANIVFFSKVEKDGNISYGEGGSSRSNPDLLLYLVQNHSYPITH